MGDFMKYLNQLCVCPECNTLLTCRKNLDSDKITLYCPYCGFEICINRSNLDKNSVLDKQVGGSHYKNLKIQPIELLRPYEFGFCEGNIIKYVTRYKDKGGKKDLEKAIQYIDFILEMPVSLGNVISMAITYCAENDLDKYQTMAVMYIVLYHTTNDKKYLEKAKEAIQKLIELNYNEGD